VRTSPGVYDLGELAPNTKYEIRWVGELEGLAVDLAVVSFTTGHGASEEGVPALSSDAIQRPAHARWSCPKGCFDTGLPTRVRFDPGMTPLVWIGHVPIKDFTRDDAKAAMAKLPPTSRTSAARRQYAQLISRMLNLAGWPLELIAANPLPRGFLPTNASRKAKSFLLPAEDAALIACGDVPFERRVLYGFLARTGCRLGEALGVEWRHIDLEQGRASRGHQDGFAAAWADA
jgi:hypothetical protein